MKRFTQILLLFVLSAATTFATRPLRSFYNYAQSDGTLVRVAKAGNAFFNYYVTTDGQTLLQNESGDLCYAVPAQVGDADALTCSDVVAHNPEMRTRNELSLLQQSAQRVEVASRAAMRAQRLQRQFTTQAVAVNPDGTGNYGQRSAGVCNSIGAPVIPVIMVDFPNCAFKDTTTIEKVTRWFNEEGYNDELYARGSIRDYYVAQSGGLYNPTFKVVAKVTANNGYATYGNKASGGVVYVTNTLLGEVLQKAADQGVDFSEFKNAQGAIELVSLYHAGPGAHSAKEKGSDSYIWAHYQGVNDVSVQGISVNGCFIGNELLQTYDDPRAEEPKVIDAHTDGIGVFCHEFGHALGLPDFYYTGKNNDIAYSLLSMDYWSVMDYGQYCYDGYRPVGYNAYERCMVGWQKVVDLTDTLNLCKLYAFSEAPEDGVSCYRILNPQNPKEYFLLENRQSGQWYPSFMGHGMLITYIDYNRDIWSAGSVNNEPNRQRFTYVPADGEKEGVNDGASWTSTKSDLFPGTTERTVFNADYYPTWTMFRTGQAMTDQLLDISEEERVVSFGFNTSKVTSLLTVPTAAGAASEAYTLDGRLITRPVGRGIFIVRQPDGTWRKQLR